MSIFKPTMDRNPWPTIEKQRELKRDAKARAPAMELDTLEEIFRFLFGIKDINGLTLPEMLEAQGVESYSVSLVGSRASNSYRKNSDWDINIETSPPVSDEITLTIGIRNLLSEKLGLIVLNQLDLRIESPKSSRPCIRIENFEAAMKIVRTQTAEA